MQLLGKARIFFPGHAEVTMVVREISCRQCHRRRRQCSRQPLVKWREKTAPVFAGDVKECRLRFDQLAFDRRMLNGIEVECEQER